MEIEGGSQVSFTFCRLLTILLAIYSYNSCIILVDTM